MTVVPARAGVIQARPSCVSMTMSRPRPRGGHPDAFGTQLLTGPSSPPARGSSAVRVVPVAGRRVVPARAGVIPMRHPRPAGSWGRPRPRGGHPLDRAQTRRLPPSSPPARGSSAAPGAPGRRSSVVPARAGVIRKSRCCGGRTCRRPRPRGGHPRSRRPGRGRRGSSPPARGSSRLDRLALRPEGVVPARAGVIRVLCAHSLASASRPRPRGGHP